MSRIDRAIVVAALSLAVAMALSGCGRATEASSLASARTAIAKRDLGTAVIQLKNVLDGNPSSAEARYLLGSTLLDQGNLVAAEVELRKAKDLQYTATQWSPALARTMLLRQQFKQVVEEFGAVKLADSTAQADLDAAVASALAMLGQPDRATARIDATLQSIPDHAPSLLLKARLLARPGSLDQALAILDKVVQRNPDNAEAWQLLGDTRLYGSRDTAQAAKAYGKVLDLQPTSIGAHSALVFIQLVGKDIPAARKQLAAMEKALPGNPQARFLGARIEFLDGNAAKARELIQPLLRVAPNNVALLEFAGAVELQLNAPIKAEALLGKALAQSADLPASRRLLADAYLRGGKSAKALGVLRPNIDRGQPDVQSLNLAAQAHMQMGDIKQAELLFQQAVKLAPNDPKYKTALALTMLAKGQTESAFNELKTIAAGGQDTLADMTLISALMRRQQWDEALRAIDGLERKQADKPTAANLRGRVLLARRDLPGARKNFESALAKDPAFLPAMASLAAIDVAESKPQQAEARYAAMLKVDPKLSQAYLALAQLKLSSGGGKDEARQLIEKAVQADPNTPAPRLALVHQAIGQRDMKAAMTAAQAGVAAMPENVAMLDALGSIQLLTGESNQAISTYNKIATMEPSAVKYQLRLADAYLQGKDYVSAERSFKRALDISPTEVSAQRGLIALSVRDKQPARALEIARGIQRQRPDHGVGYMIEGDLQVAFKNHDAAIKAYRAGIEKPNSGQVLERLHAVLTVAKGKAEAARFADDWIKQHPADTNFMVYLGNTALAGNDLPAAEGYFSKIVKLNPRHGLAMNNLAFVTAKQGKEGSVAMAEKATQLLPENAGVLDTLAYAFAAENQIGKAIETQKAVLVLAPDEPVYRLNLARFLIRTGEKSAARSELERLVPLGAKFARQQEVGELLKGLR